MADTRDPTLAQYFDDWYAGMRVSPVKDEIQRRHLGLPAHLQSTSLLGWAGIAEVTSALELSPGATLLDLACGRGEVPDSEVRCAAQSPRLLAGLAHCLGGEIHAG